MSSSDDEVVGQKRKHLERTARSNKSRRVIDDDDDQEANTFGGTADVSKMNSAADDMKSKILGRLKKSGERSREKERKEEDRKKKKEADKIVKAKKPSEPSIPRRKGSETSKKENPSLLSSLKTPTNTSSASAKAESSSSPLGNQPRPAVKSHQKQRLEPAPLLKNKVPNSMVESKLSHPPVDPSGLQQRPFSSPSSLPHPTWKKSSTGLPAMVWQSLSELCAELTQIEDKPFRLVPEKPSSSIDLSASMMKYREYDWFDVDAKGAIVLKPKIPMFPEEFPPGMHAHDLKWFGIVDPAIGARKDKGIVADAPKVNEKESKQEPSPENDNGRFEGRGHSRGSRDRKGNRSPFDNEPPPEHRRRDISEYRRKEDDRRPYSDDRRREDDRRQQRFSEDRGPARHADTRRSRPPKHPEERSSRGRYLDDSRLSRHADDQRARHDRRSDEDRRRY